MLLTISTTHRPATDLGYLLHKHPERVHHERLSFGEAHVVFPEADDERCCAALLVELDPVGLVRDRQGAPRAKDASLDQYVNDRPYAASSFLSVAMAKCFSTAIAGRSRERPELAGTAIPLRAELPVLPCRGGEALLRRLFAPLGYELSATPLPLDPSFPQWGDSRYLAVALEGTLRLSELLSHLFVLLPVLDDAKHYWVGGEEVDKLLRRGGEWLAGHPERELVTRRYLRHDRRLVSDALARLVEEDVVDDPDEAAEVRDAEEAALERSVLQPSLPADAGAEEASLERAVSLGEQRIVAVLEALRRGGARRVVDLGCGAGQLVRRILTETAVEHVLGVDVSPRALQAAARRLHLDTMAPRQRERVALVQGSLTYRDRRLVGFDAATVVEVIEHLDTLRLQAFERVLFAHARPRQIVLTTPNREYNARFAGLAAGSLRHRDHRFEWTRAELADWAASVAARHGYRAELSGIGAPDPELGQPTQLAVFTLEMPA